MSFEHETDWGYTKRARDRHGDTYKGRPLIGRDTVIIGGVDYGTFPGPPIVVDPVKYPDSFQRLFDDARQRATVDGALRRGEVLDAVFNVVRESMTYSLEKTRYLGRSVAQPGETVARLDDKIALNVYIDRGVGTCREMALTCGALLEMFKAAGHIRGNPSIDRNMQWNPRKADYDGHQWVRYTNAAGEVYILDVAQNFIGSLDDAERSAKWNYARPEERNQIIADRSQPPETGRTEIGLTR
jgi:hypothetical protein